MSEAAEVAKSISETLAGRSTVNGITIDGPASKDLDDAFWLERLSDGSYRLSISITDVGVLLTAQTTPTLDQEARQRAFTRYFADHRDSMLPETISEGCLSLLEGQPRPTLTMTIPFDASLHAGEPVIQQTLLTSLKQFHYKEVDREIEDGQTEFAPLLQDAFRLAQGLYQARRANGALALYDLTTGWATTEEGALIKLSTSERHKAHLLIQELMILANQSLALYFAQRGIPALYRNHAAKAIAPERFALLRLLETTVAHPERIRTTVSLALERACYAPTVEGHFGLNLPAYLHWTSPLRRYPDLVNQQILHATLTGEPSPFTSSELEAIAAQVNTEEATIKDAKKAFFLAEYDQPLQRIIQEATQDDTSSAQPLAHLDAKHFHSVLRMATEGHVLLPAVEQELYRRLEEQTLEAHDLFTLVFRFHNSGETWERVKRAVLHWLQDHPSSAVSMLQMGQQILGWESPTREIMNHGTLHARIFQARVTVKVAGQSYISSLHTATQKDLAKQRADAEILAAIAGIKVVSTSAEAQDEMTRPKPVPPLPKPKADSATLLVKAENNTVGLLNELRQQRAIDSVTYVYDQTHDATFACTCRVVALDGREIVRQACGKKKKEAAQKAAFQICTALLDDDALRDFLERLI
jgi:ribonuclease R